MTKIVQYERQGNKFFKFRIYAGYDNNSEKRKYVKRSGFKTRKEANIALKKLEYQIAAGNYKQKPIGKRFSDIYEAWLVEYKNTVKESTLATTERIVSRHVLPVLGKRKVDTITVIDCQRAVNLWFKDSPRVFNKYIVYTNDVMQFAIKLGFIKNNPMMDVTKPKRQAKISDQEFSNFYSKEELKVFLTACKNNGNQKIYTFFRLLAYSGLRKGEALGLTWNCIDFNNQLIKVEKTVSKGLNNRLLLQTPKTRSSNRKIILDLETLRVLRQWKVTQSRELLIMGCNSLSGNQMVFNGRDNGLMQPTTPTNWIGIICKKYHLRQITPHGFRHTHCSLLFEAGASIQEVKDRLGHSNIQTTMNVYTHVTKNKRNETADLFANYIGM